MSHRDNQVEVLGCDASIVKNVWEIRLKETEAKQKQEELRQQKSALGSINEDWSQRLAARMGQKYVPKKKQLERSATVDVAIDSSNAFASKQPLAPPPGFNSSRGAAGRGGSGPSGATGRGGPGLVRSNTLPSPSVSKDKKKMAMPNKELIKLQLLTSINQTQPSMMVWSKSWKYNKSLPKPGDGEEVASTWGQCWRLAVQQPYSEEVKPWPNGPNQVDYHGLRLFKNYVHRMTESHELDLDLWDEWQMSWQDSQRQAGKSSSSQKGGDDPKHGMFSSLVETQHQNEAWCTSEWSDSWQSTKPQEESEQTEDDTENGPTESPVAMAPKNGMPSSSWKFMHHQLHYKSKQSSAVQNGNLHPDWDKSWRAAVMVTNALEKPDSSPNEHQKDDHHDAHDNNEDPLHKVIVSVSRESKYRDWLKSLQCDQHQPLSEWKSSYEMTKNNSKPSEEFEKLLNAAPAKVQVEKVEKPKEQHSLTERTDPRYEQLRHEVIYQPRMQFTNGMLLRLRHLENASAATEWKNSWQTLKHYMRLERRRMRPHPSRPFREASKGGERKPDMSEWKDSWKYTNKPLNQEAELWQQDWPTFPRVRPDRAMAHNHFIEPMEMPKNGPGAAHIWDDSWRMPQPRPQPEVHHQHHQPGQFEQGRRQRSVADWQESWMVSDSQFHHDRPSLTQWMDAWRQSGFHAEHLHEHLFQHSGAVESIVIAHWRGMLPLQKAKAKMSQSFDFRIFRERYPEKQWMESWKATCLLSCSSGMAEQGGNSHTHEHSEAPATAQTSEWGMSFRIANPMPHVDKPWVQCSPNPSHHMAMFTRGTGSRRKHLFAAISKDHSEHKFFAQYFKIWGKSYRFLMGPSGQATGKSSSSSSPKQQKDPWVLMIKNIQIKKYLYANINHDSPDGKKWAGGHLLCKTQPKPKRSSGAPVKKAAVEEADTTADNKFLEEWSESWRWVVQPQSLKKKVPVKNLSGWGDSWKFLLPPYPTQNGPMRKAM